MSTPRPPNDGNVTANDFYQKHYCEFPLCFEQQPEVFKFAEAYANSRIEEAAKLADAWYNAGTGHELNKYELPSEPILALKGTK